jgi:hypothetical protein
MRSRRAAARLAAVAAWTLAAGGCASIVGIEDQTFDGGDASNIDANATDAATDNASADRANSDGNKSDGSRSDGSRSDGSGSDGSTAIPNSSCSDGLKSITVSPATTSMTLVYSATQMPLTQALTAQGTFMDGSTKDITSCAVWSVTPAGPVMTPTTTVTGGAFSTTAPGSFTVTVGAVASMGSTMIITGTATVTVKLTGTVNASNITTTVLDGTPSGTAPTIAYPLDGALFPMNFGDLGWQVVPSSAKFTTGRIDFEGDAISLQVYAPCTPIGTTAAPATSANACSIAIPTALETDLAAVSEATNLTETVRVSDGTTVAESAPISVRWAQNPLAGSIYYSTMPPNGTSGASEVIRMNLATPGTPPEVLMTNLDIPPYAEAMPPYGGPDSSGNQCIGCHAISQNGSKLGITIGGTSVSTEPDGKSGGGSGSWFALVNVANKIPIAARIVNSMNQFLPSGFADITTFSSDGSNMVQMLQGSLFLRTADANLTSTGPLFPSMTESMTQPYWSYDGSLLTFASWVPTGAPEYDPEDINGNEIVGAQIWTAPATGTTFGTPSILVPRASGVTEYYPTVSEDNALVAFDESSCSGPASPSADGYGASPCDSYDDPSAHLRLVAKSGGTPVDLDKASQRTSGWPSTSTWTNSWPRFAPPAPSGTPPSTFQGKTLYWLAFSSRLPYGATLAGSQSGATPPQIWFAAVAVDASGALSGDPSFAPVWLPQQNSATAEVLIDGGAGQTVAGNGTPADNHMPQWVSE